MRRLIVVAMLVLASVFVMSALAADDGQRFPISGLAAGDTVFTLPADQSRLLDTNNIPSFEALITGTGVDTIGFFNKIETYSIGGQSEANLKYWSDVGWTINVVTNGGSGIIVLGYEPQ
jgi:hypothetical protein